MSFDLKIERIYGSQKNFNGFQTGFYYLIKLIYVLLQTLIENHFEYIIFAHFNLDRLTMTFYIKALLSAIWFFRLYQTDHCDLNQDQRPEHSNNFIRCIWYEVFYLKEHEAIFALYFICIIICKNYCMGIFENASTRFQKWFDYF